MGFLLQGVLVLSCVALVAWAGYRVTNPRPGAEAEYWFRKVREFDLDRDS